MTDALKKRLSEFFDKYKNLDDAQYLLSHNLGYIKRLAASYKTDLSEFLFLLIDEKTIARASYEAANAYSKAIAAQIKSGALKKTLLDRGKLVDSLLETWRAQADSIAANQSNNLYAKGAQFQALATAAEIPAQRAAEIGANEITAARIGGKFYQYRELNSIWERMNESYGQRDTIQFRNGVNYPLRSYVDGRQNTTEAETHRAATIIEASADGVWFGTTNKTGTTDSCIFHEGETFFMNDEARTQATEKYGNLPALQSMRTWAEIVADKTHMGKFNCKHVVRPVMLQFYAEKRAVDALNGLEFQTVPKKINEQKVFEQATGRKWVSTPDTKTRPNFEPIAPRGADPQAYTIA
ncbi:MAG: hypothetical protein IPJ01_12050 [Micavibrio sp.]|nr:hypothetical protein [Micavibrio sp.]